VLVAHHLPKPCAYLITALACLHVRNFARRKSLKVGGMREKRAGRSGDTNETPCDSSAREKGNRYT
jgi:hypothetical protein